MKKTDYLRYPILLTLILTISFLGLAQPGAAQTPTPTLPATSTNGSGAPVLSADLTLADWGYEDVLLTGPYGYAFYDIGLPQLWKMQPGGSIALEVNYVYTGSGRLVNPQTGSSEAFVSTANVQVFLNDTLVYQTNLYEQGLQTLSISLPDVWPERTTERDRLEVFFHIYGPCEDTLYSSLTIFKESAIKLFYSPDPLALDLSAFPSPFYQRTFLPNNVRMVLPEKATDHTIEAGLSIASGLGSLSNNRAVISATTTLDLNPGTPFFENGILIGTPDNNGWIAYLNDNYDLPASLHSRLYDLSISGPEAAAPASEISYQISVKNSENRAAENLSVRVGLPQGAGEYSCTPECQADGDQVKWDSGALAPDASVEYKLTLVTPEKGGAEAVYLTAELVQGQEVVNVSTVETKLNDGSEPNLLTSQPASGFFFVRDGQAVAETDGVIQLLPSPWQADKALLIVSGLTDEAVLKAGRTLGMAPDFPGMIGQTAIVEDIRAKSEAEKQQTMDVTLADLGYEDITVTGTGLKEIYYSFDLPLGWAFTQEAYVRLLFSHSPLLDPERSSISLFFNSTPVASVALDESNAAAGELVGPLPANSSRPGRANNLLLRIELMLPDPCADPETSQAWLRIDSQSLLHLAHSEQDVATYLKLDYWPLPFIDRSDLSDVLFALPVEPTDNEYTQALRISSYLGASVTQDNYQPAVSLGDPTDSARTSHHLIVIGRPTRNPVLQAANADLPQPFWPGTDGIQQEVDQVIFRLPENLDLGYLQFIPSPWSANHAFLAVTGTSDRGMEQAASFLVDAERNWQLAGDLVLLKNDEALTANLGQLTLGGKLTEIATILPEATIVGTATPAPRPTSTPPAQTIESAINTPPSYPQRFPYLLPIIVGGGVVAVLVVVGALYLQSRKPRRTNKT